MGKLEPMTQAEFDAYYEAIIPDYAADNVRAGYWTEDESLEKSRQQTERFLPQGLQTKDNYLYTLRDNDQYIGMIWFKADLDRPLKSGFIFDVRIDDKFRGKGYGKEIMLLIEEKARELDIKRIGLHVFGYNKVAKNLYERIGYRYASYNMLKDLE